MVRPILRPLFQRAVRGAQSPGGRMFMAGSAPVWLDTLTDPGSALDVDITETISTDLSNVAENSDQKNKKANEPPKKCYEPIPHDKTGNFKLPVGCVYCPHKFVCHSDSNEGNGLRVFKYSNSNVFMTTVANLPKVEEITSQYE